MQSFYSNGKLLITGEYVVLDGAEALAVPTRFGQNLTVQKLNINPTLSGKLGGELIWESFTDKNELWLQVEFDLPKLRIISATFDATSDGGNDSLAENLQNILFEAKKLNQEFLLNQQDFYIKSKLTFPRNWGLGSSSTLINNIAQWAKVDTFQLQFNTFGGSGYDIACAKNDSPILYKLTDKKPSFKSVAFNPNFKEQLYFVHLNKKQNSREGIAAYKKFKKNNITAVDEISQLTHQISNCTSLTNFEELLIEHERIISKIINQEPIQKQLFSGYFGQTKSLGAWGGDFILATGNNDTPNYFKQKGFKTIIPYSDMILCKK
ncbi:MAG: GHMP kinase [Flavobacteriaceae bacterium]|nr:GHMP kinase [Flavobacteriaceae bacterium]